MAIKTAIMIVVMPEVAILGKDLDSAPLKFTYLKRDRIPIYLNFQIVMPDSLTPPRGTLSIHFGCFTEK